MNEEVNRHYKIKSLTILAKLFNKNCDCNEPSLVFLKVKNRDTVGRCSNCQKQVSITSKTPFDNFKLPLSYFSYILHDQILQYPKVVTSTEISRKLNLPYKTAYYLKRRIQVVTSLLNETLQKQLYNELEEYGNKNPIKLPKSGDLRPLIANKPVAVADSVVLYSSSLRANKHRSRRYKTGTSSIYLSNSLGGEQKGILVHTVGVNHGMTFYKSIPLNNQSYLLQDLNSKIPQAIPLFTDEGYTFIWDRPNHRMVNHSKKSSDHRYNLSRERWITKDGVSSNGAEARNNTLKQSFRSYHYISPKWSQLYLDEISFLGNLRYSEGLKKLLLDDTDVGLGDRDYSLTNYNRNTQNLKFFHYKPLSLEERRLEGSTNLINSLDEETLNKLPKSLRHAIEKNNHFWKNPGKTNWDNAKRRNEHKSNLIARKLWVLLEHRKWTSLEELIKISGYNRLEILFILKRWLAVGLIDMSRTNTRYIQLYKIYKKSWNLYYLVYSERQNELRENWRIYNKKLKLKSSRSKIVGGVRKYGN
ncbi:hypothetical protein LPTSP3_g14940 [Leptospira kobayashii]|uniref:ISXO2-like transposase domain-containing protein n=1 Tax=Leptospira kobayashii TaxID=1917830 RepID=A0ABM7UIJ0_9LEPT|nr:transposase [Leptospira kobayashii]BDA78564.1 hypothetical protein LPTSP3_g14940 [Leptospira kobayashii]